MKKRAVRCFHAYAEAGGIYNHEVFYLTYEGFSNFVLATCTNCGELFVIDKENPQTAGLNIEQIANDQHCPNCNAVLRDTIKQYPQTFRTKSGIIGSFSPSNQIPPESESLIMEFWEVRPSKNLS